MSGHPVDEPGGGQYRAGNVSVSVPPSSSHSPVLNKGMWEVTWPLLFSFALSLSLHFVDSFFLSRVSDEAAGAVGAILPLLGSAIVLFGAVGQAGGSVASQLMGARRHAEVPVAYLALVVFNLLVGALVSALALLFHGKLTGVLGLTGKGAEYASSYFALLGGCQFLKALQIAYANILTSRGDTRWVMAEALITNACNIGLNVAFLQRAFGLPRLGVLGVALATVSSLAVGLTFTICVVRFRFHVKLPFGTRPAELWARMKSILAIGLPSALEPISYQAMQITVNTMVVTWGTAALAARVYVLNFVIITSILWSLAFGLGTQILVAHRIGARRFDEADAVLRRGLRFGIWGNFCLSGLLALGQGLFLRALTSDVAVHRLAAPLFFLGMLVEPARAANIVIGGALRSSGDARYSAGMGVLFMWVVAIPACYVFGRVLGFGLIGIWSAFAVDETVRGIVNYRRWRKGHWKHSGVVAREPLATA